MNALTQRNKTFGELMAELRARLGFVTQGSASKGNEAVLKSFLQEAHEYVYSELDPPALRTKSTIAVEANSYLYDWHDDQRDLDIEPGQVLSIWVKSSDTTRRKLAQGISESYRANTTMRGEPERYDTIDGQLEIYPIPDRAYELIVEHIAGKGRFDRASDRTSVPDRLVFLYALASTKAHYRHPDAQVPAKAFEVMLGKAKTKQKENSRFVAASMTEGASINSQVARTANGYTLAA